MMVPTQRILQARQIGVSWIATWTRAEPGQQHGEQQADAELEAATGSRGVGERSQICRF